MNIKIIKHPNEIPLSSKWAPATKFNSKDALVDEKGNKVSADYQGRLYRIIEKRERTFNSLERLERGFLGTVLVICTFCLALFSKWVRDMFTKSKESIHFAVLARGDDLRASQRSSTGNDDEFITLESVEESAPWEYSGEPSVLPEHWVKHRAEQKIVVNYCGEKVTIPRGDNYFTYRGKVAIGWHGTYNPPGGM